MKIKKFLEKIKEVLKNKDIDSLEELAISYRIEDKLSLSKEEFIEILANKMIEKRYLKENAIIYLNNKSEFKEEDYNKKNIFSKRFSLLDRQGFAEFNRRQDREVLYAFENDDILKYYNVDRKSREYILYSKFKKYIKATLNLYGVIEIDIAINRFNELCEDFNIDIKILDNLLRMLIRDRVTVQTDGIFLIHECFVENNIDRLLSLIVSREIYRPSYDELLKYENELYRDETIYLKRFKVYMENVLKADEDAILEILIGTQMYGYNKGFALTILENYGIKLLSGEKESFLKIYIDLVNNTRSWVNRGNTLKEIHKGIKKNYEKKRYRKCLNG